MLAQTDDRIMSKAVFILKKMSADEKMQEIARIRERAMHDEASFIEDAMAKGEARGIAKGMAKGRAEGMAKGMAKGRAEGVAEGRNAIIEKMRESGMSDDAIRAIIG